MARNVLRGLLHNNSGVNPDQVRAGVWNSDVEESAYSGDRDKYQLAVLEQYKLYVEMADRISARRALANTFFLSLNTAVFTALGIFLRASPSQSHGLLVVPLIVLLGQCLAWYWLVRSYRQLNSAKYMIVGLLEERLPASPYWSAEWKALGEGKDPSIYLPLTHLEQWVPILFFLAYLGGFFAFLIL